MAEVLTAERLRELVHYDVDTGVFTRLIRTAQCNKVGEKIGCLSKAGYLTAHLLGRHYYLHRLALLYVTGVWPSSDVDHINGVKHENQYRNLRSVRRQVNAQNRRSAKPGTKTGLLGAYEKNNGDYFSQIRLPDGSSLYLGRFDTAEQAHAAYVQAKRRVHEGNTL